MTAKNPDYLEDVSVPTTTVSLTQTREPGASDLPRTAYEELLDMLLPTRVPSATDTSRDRSPTDEEEDRATTYVFSDRIKNLQPPEKDSERILPPESRERMVMEYKGLIDAAAYMSHEDFRMRLVSKALRDLVGLGWKDRIIHSEPTLTPTEIPTSTLTITPLQGPK